MVGRKVLRNGHPFTGRVAMPGSRGTSAAFAAELWVPIAAYRDVYPFPERFLLRSEQALRLIGRLKPGIPTAAMESELRTIGARLEHEFPSEDKELILAPVSMARAGISPAAS